MSVLAAPKPGDVLAGKYELVRVLGEGGMGVVFEARHRRLQQPVALKTLLPEMLAEPVILARFEREARAAAKLRTPYAAKTIDVDVTPEGLPFIVMELLEGRDLATLLREKTTLPVAEAVDYVLQAAAAMLDAHGKGIVHRDLKPSNLFLARDRGVVRIKVLDFGISKEVVQRETGLTRPGTLVGTMAYVAPEQLSAASTVDARADVWSLGVVLYELVTGQKPFRGDDVRLAAAIMMGTPASLRTLRSDVPAELDAVIFRALAKDRAQRLGGMAELMRALLPFAPPNSTFDDYVQGVLARPSDPKDDVAFADTIIQRGPMLETPTEISLPAAPPLPRELGSAPKEDATDDAATALWKPPPSPSRSRRFVAAGLGTLLGAGVVGAASYVALMPRAPQWLAPTPTFEAPAPADAGTRGASDAGATDRR